MAVSLESPAGVAATRPSEIGPATGRTAAGQAAAAAAGTPAQLVATVIDRTLDGALLNLAGRQLLLQGGELPEPGSQVRLLVPNPTDLGSRTVQARLVTASGEQPVRLAPVEQAVLFGPREVQAVPARLALDDGTAEIPVRVVLTASAPTLAARPGGGAGGPLRALETLAAGEPLPVTSLAPEPGAAVRLSGGGLVVRLESGEVPPGTNLELRLREPMRQDAGGTLEQLREPPAATAETSPATRGSPLAADATLASRLRTETSPRPLLRTEPEARDQRFQPNQVAAVVAGQAAGLMLLGDQDFPQPLQWQRGSGESEEGGRSEHLNFELDFGQLGRLRLEVRRYGTAVQVNLRSEQPLPRQAHADLAALADAAFELTPLKASLVISQGELRAAPPAMSFLA